MISKNKERDELLISDHALVRYFERVIGLDMERIKGEILTEDLLKLFKLCGNRFSYDHPKGYKIVVYNGYITTISPQVSKKSAEFKAKLSNIKKEKRYVHRKQS